LDRSPGPCLVAGAGARVAHPVPFSYLDIRLQPQAITGTLVVHILDVAHDLSIAPAERLLDPAYASNQFNAVTRLVGERLQIAFDGQAGSIDWVRLEVAPERQSLRLQFRMQSPRIPASMQIAGSLFPYDANHKTFVNVYEGDALTQAILDRSKTTFEYFAGTRQGTFAVVRKFLPSGIHHILIGPDHLLFLIGLLLLGGNP
jgi:hypothetical protein